MLVLSAVVMLLAISFAYYARQSPPKKELFVYLALSVLGVTLHFLHAIGHPFSATAFLESFLPRI
ncbi:conserved hypothetical protein [Paenibacillus curdlanolyticus YK9]|uniref:Uncharacterized protein n=1 Tax=Paenibacillus curdlanolyticus YK9 TaxID=717606 RepID=E0I613_9BACL|nr:hypothetical protein [Paenibacillus curdlanolyticus]EFM12405.1 conserved hypothetical protein [Paenibacillus curdlanolyticus YK9]